ncbi:hypothetical protein J7J08_11920 [Stenotrophomonas sp. ISL-67]|uniref:hypothetical protein n=1 Tax=Stenotrophomonas sp. ISL-67 TaxID=2819171 RepID=UPI001BE9FD58|nr:hypothetical protein [Stenotrophomonas sp. ISL-67]MBT2768346.1 hypothetical protein [Stenotrophomonas sp. ISL-67]
MRRSISDLPSNEQPQTGIGLRAPEHLRIGSFKHPGGHPLPGGGRIPCLMLRGLWLDRFELPVGGRVVVQVEPKRITLTLDETPVPVPYRYQDHVPKRAR